MAPRQLTGRDLHVLFSDRIDDIVRGHTARGQTIRVEPNAHGIITRSQQLDIADTR